MMLTGTCAMPNEMSLWKTGMLTTALTGQSMAQMALAWTLRDPRVTSAIIGASRASQITENIGALQRLTFTEDELRRIDAILKED